MNKIIATALTTISLLIAQTSVAESHRFDDFAKVKQVTPIYKTIERRIPEETCWTETVRHEHHTRRSSSSALVGSLIGGAIGHSAGHGKRNKKVGAVIGSIIGASIGNDIENRKRRAGHHQRATYKDLERCETRYTTQTKEHLMGYDVTYQYRGERYTTHMHEHPGKRIKVKISLSPVIDYKLNTASRF